MTGDLVPIIKSCWRRAAEAARESKRSLQAADVDKETLATTPFWPQFLGPFRNSTLPDGLKLARDWTKQPPQKLWRQPIGPAWWASPSLGNAPSRWNNAAPTSLWCATTLRTGHVLWSHADAGRFANTVAGEGPRTTPTSCFVKVSNICVVFKQSKFETGFLNNFADSLHCDRGKGFFCSNENFSHIFDI